MSLAMRIRSLIPTVFMILCSISYGDLASSESRVRVALLDTGMPMGNLLEPVKEYICKDKNTDLTDTTIEDVNGHGTNLIYLISKYINPKKACINVIKVYSMNSAYYVDGIKYSVLINAKYINMSAGGLVGWKEERNAILLALLNNIRFITAAGNNGLDLSRTCSYYPACYKFDFPNFYVVANGKDKDHLAIHSNFNGPTTNYEDGMHHCEAGHCMSGTSQATAIWTGKLVKKELR